MSRHSSEDPHRRERKFYHLVTNQKSKYLLKKSKFTRTQIIQLTTTEYLVPSESVADKLQGGHKKKGSCECFKGSLNGPCKHKASVVKEYKMKNFCQKITRK